MGTVAEVLISLSRWPLLLVAVAFGLALLYRFGPSRARARVALGKRGSGVAAVLWIAVSVLFSWYRGEFRQVQRDLWFARRRHRLHDVDLDLDDRDPRGR